MGSCGHALPWLLRQLGDGSLLFEGVDEGQDASLHAGGDATGYGVARRRGTTGLLGRGAGHQAFLVPQLHGGVGVRAEEGREKSWSVEMSRKEEDKEGRKRGRETQ